jgi:hypothetical protein
VSERQTRGDWIAAIITAALVFAVMLWMLHLATDHPAHPPVEIINEDGLAPCPTEDSTDCYWDADTMGNGHGRDVIDLGSDGVVEVSP